MSAAMGNSSRGAGLLRWSALTVLALLFVGVPLWLVVVNSFKTQPEAAELGLTLPEAWNALENYSAVITDSDYLRGLVNSLIVTTASVALLFAIAAPAAWAIARSGARWMQVVYVLAIIGVVLPPAVVPMVFLMRGIGLQGTLPALILFTVGMRVSLVVFLLTGFARGLPRELEEAAFVDGATRRRTFFSVVLPLMRPILWSAFIITVVLVWNDFYGPMFLLTGDNATLPLGLYRLSSGIAQATAWNSVFAHVVLVSLPLILVYVVIQRRVVEGVTAGAVKG